jgi:chemotaxis signal transduction protein
VVVETAAGVAGVLVDDVREVVTVTSAELRRASARDEAFAVAVAQVGDRLVTVLDPDEMFDRAELEAVA